MPLSPDRLSGWIPDGVIRLNTGPDGFVHEPERGPGTNSIPNAFNRMEFYNVRSPSPQELIAQAMEKIKDAGVPINELKCCVTRDLNGKIVSVQFLHEAVPLEEAFLTF